MSFATKHNTGSKFNFETPENFEYFNLKELANRYGINAIHKVNAIYINKKSEFGLAPVIATDSELVNVPHYMIDSVQEILSDSESIGLINRGYVGFKVVSYENKFGKHAALEWVDIDSDNFESPEPKSTKAPAKKAAPKKATQKSDDFYDETEF